MGRAGAVGGEFLCAAVALDEVGQDGSHVRDLGLAEAFAQFGFHLVALGERAATDGFAGGAQAQVT